MFVGVLAFVWRFGINVPFSDDWYFIPQFTGDEPMTATWLWEPHFEHRIPLPKLLLVGLARLTDCDFRAGAYFNCVALGGIALAMILVAMRVRGRVSYTDAFFPLALLHWGQVEILLRGFQIQFISSVVLFCLILLVIVSFRGRPKTTAAVLLGLCLLGLPFCGANGLALAPPLIVWLGYVGIEMMRMSEPNVQRNGFLMVTFAVLALALCGLYFVGYAGSTGHAPCPSTAAGTRTTAQFLAMSIGVTGAYTWPYSALWVIGLSFAGLHVLINSWQSDIQSRIRTSGLFCLIVGIVCLALGLGWGRAGLGETAGLVTRYVSLAAPLLCILYYVWLVAGNRFVPRCLFALMCSIFVSNTFYGFVNGREWGIVAQLLEKEIRAGEPPSALLARWSSPDLEIIPQISETELANRLEMLGRIGMGPDNSSARGSASRRTD
jgi:hypothetical protein